MASCGRNWKTSGRQHVRRMRWRLIVPASASCSSAAGLVRRFWLTPGNGTAQNGRRNKTQGQAPARTINWRTMRFATAPFSLAGQPFKAIRWTREAFGRVITTKLTILIIFSTIRGNGTARNGAGSPTLDRHHAADTEWDSMEPECYSSAARDPHISAIHGTGMGNTGHNSRTSVQDHAHPLGWSMIVTGVAVFSLEGSARTPTSAILGNCTSILNLTECRAGSQPANPRARLPYTSSVAVHLIVSSTAGHPACTPLRKCLKIGRANSAGFSIYAATSGSFFARTNHSTVAPVGE